MTITTENTNSKIITEDTIPLIKQAPMGDNTKTFNKVKIYYEGRDVSHHIEYALSNIIHIQNDKRQWIGYVDKGSLFLKPGYEPKWKHHAY
jgi:hypothetical protein